MGQKKKIEILQYLYPFFIGCLLLLLQYHSAFGRDSSEILKNEVQHIVVLMLENHSFDNLFGFSQLNGIDENGMSTQARDLREVHGKFAPPYVIPPTAEDRFSFDPPHEYWEVLTQLPFDFWKDPKQEFNLPENFVGSALRWVPALNGDLNRGLDVLKVYPPEKVPVITTLAREYAIADMAFSPVPGATFPNRLFVHAATSGGLTVSPDLRRWIEPHRDRLETTGITGFRFKAGSIYDRFKDWRIYHGDFTPHVLTVKGMLKHYLYRFDKKFRRMKHFKADLASGDLPAYTFIEPNYGNLRNFTGGNSQHPIGDIRDGEELVKYVYEAIRKSPLWQKTLLVITYDEHGGFYDHIKPPTAIPTGDDDHYNEPRLVNGELPNEKNKGGRFDFDRLGIRVPAILISPFIAKGTIDHRVHDSSSILKTLEERFGIPPLTNRDRDTLSYSALLTRETPRQDCIVELPDPWNGQPHVLTEFPLQSQPSPAFLQVAASLNIQLEVEQRNRSRHRVAPFSSNLDETIEDRKLIQDEIQKANRVLNSPQDTEQYFLDLVNRLEKFWKHIDVQSTQDLLDSQLLEKDSVRSKL